MRFLAPSFLLLLFLGLTRAFAQSPGVSIETRHDNEAGEITRGVTWSASDTSVSDPFDLDDAGDVPPPADRVVAGVRSFSSESGFRLFSSPIAALDRRPTTLVGTVVLLI